MDTESVKQRIIASVFSKPGPSGVPEETYIGHIKIWEEAGAGAQAVDDSGRKPRYILLSLDRHGVGRIHKSKLNPNGTFSVGKTWNLEELRGLEASAPNIFNITLGRTYRWETQSQRDQAAFISATTSLFRRVTGGKDLSKGSVGIPGEPASKSSKGSNYNYEQDESNRLSTVSSSSRSNRAITPPPPPMPAPRRPAPSANGSTAGSPPGRTASPLLRIDPNTRRRPSGASSLRSASPTAAERTPARIAPKKTPYETPRTSEDRDRFPLEVPPPVSPSPSPSVRRRRPSSPQPMRRDPPSREPTPQPRPEASRRQPTPQPRPPPVERPSPNARPAHIDEGEGPIAPPRATNPQSSKRDPHARISFFDPLNQASADRLLTREVVATPGQAIDEESAEATMATVEEMLEGYEWAAGGFVGNWRGDDGKRGAADQIEARLLKELKALEMANIHSFVESDDRVAIVLKYIDEAVRELDEMDSLVTSYKIHLNAVSDDILHIQSQNRGLQVQTQNQRLLLAEVEKLMQTVHVDRDALRALTQESLDDTRGTQSIQRLEVAAAELYKALQAGRDTDMAATMERLGEYRTHNTQFCQRVLDFLKIMFTVQAENTLNDKNDKARIVNKLMPVLSRHVKKEGYLGRYSGLIIYLKEMDEDKYSKTCAAYFSAASDLHAKQMKALLLAYINAVRKAPEEENENSFALTVPSSISRGATMRKAAGAVVRSEGRKEKDKATPEGDMPALEAFSKILVEIVPQIYREEEFIADFLQINDAGFTFADYMGLDTYFQRQASRSAGLSQGTVKLIRGALDLIFGFLPAELKSWIDGALQRDPLQIVGILAHLENCMADAEEKKNSFLHKLLEKQHQRTLGLYNRHLEEQIKAIEQTKLSKRRKGVAQFIKYFPVYLSRVENQLTDANSLEIRGTVDSAYDKIVQAMFDSLQQIAKLDGEGEDKGQLTYHVVLVENMHAFISELRQQEFGNVQIFVKRAETIYEENLSSYIKLLLRRPFSKLLDFFDGVERLLQTASPSEVANDASYNKSALKRVIKEYNSKDIRRFIDGLNKRLDKHFSEGEEGRTIVADSVMMAVWKRCEEETLRFTDKFSKLLNQCYAGQSLEYNASDLEGAFKRHRVG